MLQILDRLVTLMGNGGSLSVDSDLLKLDGICWLIMTYVAQKFSAMQESNESSESETKYRVTDDSDRGIIILACELCKRIILDAGLVAEEQKAVFYIAFIALVARTFNTTGAIPYEYAPNPFGSFDQENCLQAALRVRSFKDLVAFVGYTRSNPA